MRVIIPARKGSKGFPLKNRKLMDMTFNMIPLPPYQVIVTSDDPVILNVAKNKNYNYVKRSQKLSNDTASMKDVLLDTIKKMYMYDSEILIMLYLTYPFRVWNDVENALDLFKKKNAKSLLCKQEIKEHPYLCMFEEGDNGKQIVKHNLYRRQDYPKVFGISHYIFIAKAGEIKKLNNNLYNKNTIFFPIIKPVDVDYEKDLKGLVK